MAAAWLAIKVGVFYGAPIVAVVLAVACFAALAVLFWEILTFSKQA